MKRTLATLIVLTMMIFLVTGCASTAKETTAAATPTTAAASSADSTEATETTATWKPERNVNVIVNTGAGGMTDLTVRAMSKALEEVMGVTFTVNNMTGGSGAIGANYVFDAKHDGYTLLGLSGGGCNALPVLGSFDYTSQDMDIVAVLCSHAILSVAEDSPYQTLQDLVDAGVSLNAGASQAGSCWQIMLSLFSDASGIDTNILPYEGSSATQVALLSGEIDFCVTGLAEQLDYIKSGKMRPLAVLEGKSLEVEGFGTIPSASEIVPAFADKTSEATDYISWCGMALPADCPPEVINAYNEAFGKALESDVVKEVNASLGTTMIGLYGDGSKEIMQTLDSVFQWSLYDSGIATISPEEFGVPRLG